VTHRWIAAALLGILSAWSFAVVPVRPGQPAAAGPRVHHPSTQDETVTGLWEVRTGVFRGPWTITLVQTGKTIAGTIQQSFPVTCATEPVAFGDGTIEKTEAGPVVSFDLAGLKGSTITFKGLVATTWDAIAFNRSSNVPARAVQGRGPIPFPFRPPVPGPDDDAGFLSPDGQTRFVAHRVDPTTAPPPGCQVPDTPPSRPEAPQFRRYVASAKIGFPPWTFDLTIAKGRVSGTVTQGRVDPTTRMSTIVAGPFPISNGRSDGVSIDFTIMLAEGARVVTFHGTRSGVQAITFTRRMTVVSVLSGADPGPNGIFGAEGATRFTAVLDPSVEQPPVPATIPSGVGGDDTVTLDAVDSRYAAVPAAPAGPGSGSIRVAPPAFALARYHVGPAFDGRLVLTVSDATGAQVRQFEVTATPGDHVALWNLRADVGSAEGGIPIAHTPFELETAEARAALASDLVRLGADDPDETARLLGRMAPLLTGPVDAPMAGKPSVGPGPYVCGLLRVEAGVATTVATVPLEVRAGGGR
jgi:hypothetical protein